MKGLAFHCHHDTLFEYCFDYDKRVACIKGNKPEEEQELRLRLFKIIPEELIPGRESKEYIAYVKAGVAHVKAGVAHAKAWVAYDKAWVAYVKAGVAYVEAGVAYDKAWDVYDKKYKREIKELHAMLCPNCPWDGETIFSKEIK